ncbi:MAG: DNA-protecting protein DprA [Verrucomicrobia bacterium]|nr:MAG: DNA-protecting protein DprA [Verrucomicrobiota bacterium]
MNAREVYIALNMIDKIGPVRVRALVEALGAPAGVFTASFADLVRVKGIGEELAQSIIAQRAQIDPAEEEAKAAKLDARIVTFVDDDYPELLKQIHDPPLALYVEGTLEKKDRQAVAIVGTRRATHYGLSVADRLAYQLAKCGLTVVSGLARGIDSAAHQGALKGGGRTIAVLGSALDQLYPPENAELAGKIAKQGAVISEYTLGREADRTTFPYRNRIISGLSMGAVIVEADKSSGAMMTADAALDQGRSVFAVPGRIDQPGARGPHKLIKNGARLVEDIDDILQEFELLIPSDHAKKAAALDGLPRVQLSADEQAVVKALFEEPLDLDSLARRANLPMPQLTSMLLGLEMKRVIRMLPGRIVALADGVRKLTAE